MKICVVGSGGREHALVSVLSRTADVVITPGNAGIPGSVAQSPLEIDADLFVIGPEVPLVDGLADALRDQGKRVFGPGREGARLEGSKVWMKELLAEAGVPTARFGSFRETEPAFAFLDTLAPPYVIKTDGLAAGKGVLVTHSLSEARNTVEDYLSGAAFGDAGTTLVIEEGLDGPEVSVFAICDGERFVLTQPAQDFKRVGEGDIGPNTGGMGAFSPVPGLDQAFLDQIGQLCIAPTLSALRARGIDYRGVLFAGLMLTSEGPKLLEYNVRFGDPETQVVLPRITSDLAQLLFEAAEGKLQSSLEYSPDARVTVVLAAGGYPQAPIVGEVIHGMALADQCEGVEIFCAGVGTDGDGNLLTAGGRVLNVCGTGATLALARDRAYQGAEYISWDHLVMRRDIAEQAAEQ